MKTEKTSASALKVLQLFWSIKGFPGPALECGHDWHPERLH
jgi:hypothetical protein